MRDRKLDRLFERFRRKGDASALGEVFDGTAGELLHVALSLVGDAADAEDLLQATFLTAIERADRYDASRRLVPWLLGILVRHAHELRRRRGRSGEDGVELQGAAAPERAPVEEAAAVELSGALAEALERLPAAYREVLQRVVRDGDRAVDIARATGQAPGTVRMRIHRGLDLLRKALPAGAALGAAGTTLGGRGLAAVREELVREAATAAAARAAGLGASSSAASTKTVLGGITLMKKLALVGLAVALAMAVGWLSRPAQPAPESTAPASPRAEVAILSAPEQDLVSAPPAAGDEAPRVAVTAPAEAPPDPIAPGYAAFTGRVLEHDGEPVAGVPLELFELRAGLLSRSLTEAFGERLRADEVLVARARTDAEGRFRLNGLRPRALHFLGLDLGGQRSTARVVETPARRDRETELGDIVLEPVAALRGRVLDEDGAPLPGVRVRAARVPLELSRFRPELLRSESLVALGAGPVSAMLDLPSWMYELADRLPVPTATTDAAGSFVLYAVPAGDHTVFFDRRGYASNVMPVVGLAADAEHDLGAITLPDGGRVEGRVVEADGEPVAGAEVYVGRALLTGAMSAVGFTVVQPAGATDENGRFALDGLPSGSNTVVAVRRGPGGPWEVGLFSELLGLELRLPPERSVFVRARDARGAPVEDAELILASMGSTLVGPLVALAGAGPLDFEVEQVEPGRYRIDGVGDGAYQLVASSATHGVVESRLLVQAGASETELSFAECRSVAITILDDATGEPVSGALVSAHRAAIAGPAAARGETDAEGRVEALLARPDDADGYYVLVDHPLYPPQSTRLGDPAAAGSGGWTVRLNAGGAARIAIGGASDATRYMVLLDPRSRATPEDAIPPLAVTDASGEVRFEGLAVGTYTVEVLERLLDRDPLLLAQRGDGLETVARGEITVTAGGSAELLVDVVPPPPIEQATVRGWILRDGAPWAGLTVEANVDGVVATTDASGYFELHGLAPGHCTLSVRQGERDTLWEEGFGLPHGAVHELRYDWTPIEQEVQVVDESGAPVANVWVDAWSPAIVGSGAPTGAQADERGRAMLLLLTPGSYRATAHHPTAGRARTGFEVAAGKRPDPVRMQLRAGVACSGDVVVSGGPVRPELWTLSLRGADGDGVNAAVRMEGGRGAFEVPQLTPGTYDATLWAGGWSYAPLSFELPPGGLHDVELRFERLR
ncbi:MAG: sigma-70 family RNA polymerase sigma factor [Planctomycetota bacterium]